MKAGIFVVTLLAGHLCVYAQTSQFISTEDLKADFQRLIGLNKNHSGAIDLSGKESVNIQNNATVAQVIEITAPYLNSNIINAKSICYHYLSGALSKKAQSIEERQAIVEIFCRYYLFEDLRESMTNFFIRIGVQEQDFNENAKKNVRSLGNTSLSGYGVAHLLSMAQIKESIPSLWKAAGFVATRGNLDVLASLARMDEENAAVLLCHYYDSVSRSDTIRKLLDNSVDYLYNHVLLAKHLAFSLNKTVINCLIADFNSINIDYSFRGGDYFFYPSMTLAEQITSMLKNYPYRKDFNIDPKQLKDWLLKTDKLILNDK